MSAGSMVLAPNIGQEFVNWRPPIGNRGDTDSEDDSDRTLGLVDFAMYPHLDHPDLPENTMANAEKWAAGMRVPGYAIDDDTAIKVIDGAVEVISEGHWKLFRAKVGAADTHTNNTNDTKDLRVTLEIGPREVDDKDLTAR